MFLVAHNLGQAFALEVIVERDEGSELPVGATAASNVADVIFLYIAVLGQEQQSSEGQWYHHMHAPGQQIKSLSCKSMAPTP